MIITFTETDIEDGNGVKRAWIGRDEDGIGRVVVTEWIADLIPFIRSRYTADVLGSCPCNNERFEGVCAFAVARLNNGLELDGASVEV